MYGGCLDKVVFTRYNKDDFSYYLQEEMSKTVAKQISFSEQMLIIAKRRIKELGIEFPEYIRFLVLRDTMRIREEIPYMTKEQAEIVRKARKDVEKGDVIVLKSNKEIDTYFEGL